MSTEILVPAPRPCESCPYRQDVPSGVWGASEYAKLALYDQETASQPPGLFQCHQHDATTGKQLPRVCAGWAGVHGRQTGKHGLLSLRIALALDRLTVAQVQAICEYDSPTPLFASGREACEHGVRGLLDPSAEARRIQGKIVRLRSDIEMEEPPW